MASSLSLSLYINICKKGCKLLFPSLSLSLFQRPGVVIPPSPKEGQTLLERNKGCHPLTHQGRISRMQVAFSLSLSLSLSVVFLFLCLRHCAPSCVCSIGIIIVKNTCAATMQICFTQSRICTRIPLIYIICYRSTGLKD